MWGALLVAVALAAAQIVAVDRLRKQIGHWDWITEVDGARERLLGLTRTNVGDPLILPEDRVYDAFEELAATIGAHASRGLQADVAREFATLEADARSLYRAANDRATTLGGYFESIAGSLNDLQRLSSEWAVQLTQEERAALTLSDNIDAAHRLTSARKEQLIETMIEVQEVQQEIMAIQRLSSSTAEEVLRALILGIDRDGLPRVCTLDEIRGNQRLCQPNIARVHNTLDALQDSSAEETSQALRQALWGLEGFNRAAKELVRQMSEDELRALDTASDVRARLSRMRASTAALSRINRVILDMEALIRTPVNRPEDLEWRRNRATSLISQLKGRMPGFLRTAPVNSVYETDVSPIIDEIDEQLPSIQDIGAERLADLAAFQGVMDRLSTDIAIHANAVQRETTLLVGFYATTFVVLSLLVGASVIWLVLLARSRFVAPLSEVTSTILSLSRGDLGRTFAIEEKAFGFDELGKAIEQLRHEMTERQALAIKTEEQRRTIAHNLAELARTSEEMQWLAMHDTLTGLGNRRRVDNDIAELDARDDKSNFCIMQVDIDRFKDINDTLGHAAGDFVLKTVADILRDVANRQADCYRVGGDEFLIVIQSEISEAAAREIAAELIARISKPMAFDERLCRVGASIGIAFGRDAGFDASTTVTNADLALYHTKRNGRGGYDFFTADLADRSRQRKDLSDRLLAAIEAHSFQPYYQPQFYSGGHEIRGVEVLCRWHDPKHGWIPPSEFLDAAEDLGVVGQIDEILFEKAVRDISELQNEGLSIPRISFNVTLDRLLKADLAQRLRTKVGDSVVIALELLESLSLDNPTDSVAWAIDTLKEHGIEIEIDDFGSYRASLAGLMAVSPGAMKIDRAIVMPIIESPRHLNLVKKIIDIGAALNIEVVAEGVETDSHAEILHSLGCNVLQGFGLAQPMPFNDLKDFCQRRSDCRLSKSALA